MHEAYTPAAMKFSSKQLGLLNAANDERSGDVVGGRCPYAWCVYAVANYAIASVAGGLMR